MINFFIIYHLLRKHFSPEIIEDEAEEGEEEVDGGEDEDNIELRTAESTLRYV